MAQRTPRGAAARRYSPVRDARNPTAGPSAPFPGHQAPVIQGRAIAAQELDVEMAQAPATAETAAYFSSLAGQQAGSLPPAVSLPRPMRLPDPAPTPLPPSGAADSGTEAPPHCGDRAADATRAGHPGPHQHVTTLDDSLRIGGMPGLTETRTQRALGLLESMHVLFEVYMRQIKSLVVEMQRRAPLSFIPPSAPAAAAETRDMLAEQKRVLDAIREAQETARQELQAQRWDIAQAAEMQRRMLADLRSDILREMQETRRELLAGMRQQQQQQQETAAGQ